MNRKRIKALLVGVSTIVFLTGSAFALDESEVQTAIANSSREQVSGNIFIWLLCAIAFLKVSQKIDSFMASLGINVGRTGGSMLGELMIAGRAIAGAMGSAGHSVAGFFGRGGRASGSGGTRSQPAGSPFPSGGGVVGSVRRAAGNAATASATEQGSGLGSIVGGAMFNSSLQRGGKFGTDVTHAVATGSIAAVGTMKGAKAAQALTSYLGYGAATGQVRTSPPAASLAGGAKSDGGAAGPASTAPSVSSESAGPEITLTGGSAAVAGERPQPIPQEPLMTDESVADTITLDGGAANIPTAPGSVGEPGEVQHTADAEAIHAQGPIPTQPPIFSHVEIGGGRITGYETPAEGGEARQFAMYNADQYMEPTGDYQVVQTVDGESWYKQYAVPTVQKTPREVTEKGVMYDQKIVQQLPQIPKRKDKV